jgi:hypothetical protein
VPAVVLEFQELVGQRRLDRLEEPDARELAAVLTVRRAQVYRRMAGKIRAAANRDPDDSESSEVVVLNRDELEAIHLACAEEPAFQRRVSLERLCGEVAQALAGL